MTVAWAMLLVALAGCKDDEDKKRDENGCWLSGHEAWEAYAERNCVSSCGVIAPSAYEECLEALAEHEADYRVYMCFDGCTVDACLDALDTHLETCSDEDANAASEQCIFGEEAVFYDNRKSRQCDPADAGW